jgi:hypothetical protein
MKNEQQAPKYLQMYFNVVQINKNGIILRKFENLNTYQAERVFFKIANSYPVRNGAQNVRMIEIK